MVKKDTRKKIVNPKTGRKVLVQGSIGKKLTKKSKNKSQKKINDKTTKTNKKTTKTTQTKKPKNKTKNDKNKKRKPTKKVQQSRNLANFINRIEGKKVMKVSKKGNVRLSAAQAFKDGAKLGTRHCYDGKCTYLRQDKNKRKFWSTR